jgi:uridylate kinase
MIKVISLGGSIVAPDNVDTEFLLKLTELFRIYLREDPARKLVIVVGGGGPARHYQAAYRQIVQRPDSDAQDWIGIAATRLNGELLRGLFPEECHEPLVTDPTAAGHFTGRILVAAGWKPGFSSDFDAVILAERFEADTVINLSNVSKVYTADPKKDPTAQPIEAIGWEGFRKLVGNEWTPGKNLPFDPIAARRAQELGLKVIAAAGKDLGNLMNLLTDRPFEGTTIGPD